MSFLPSYLIVRGGRFHFKMRVPSELIPVFGMRFVRKSLKTADEKAAKRSAEVLTSKVRFAFDLIRSSALSDEQTQAVVNTFKKVKPVRPGTSRKPKRLSELIQIFNKEHFPNWKPKTVDEYSSQFAALSQILGNDPADSYNRSRCLECRAVLIERGLMPKTINKYIGLLSSLFRWAVRHEYARANPAEGLLLDISKRPDKERKAYDSDDLQKIVDLLPRYKDEPWKVWIPLIGMLSGLRREEICQLHPSDIRKIQDVWCFDINQSSDDKSLKTESSERLVPVHSVLVNLGFIDFVDSRTGEQNLWGFNKWKTQWGKKFGNWYSVYFNRKHITKDLLKCFHSFRHYVADHLKQSGYQDVMISELLGHSNDSITTGRYGKKFLPPRLVEAVESLGRDVEFNLMIDLPCEVQHKG
jgi:integrase